MTPMPPMPFVPSIVLHIDVCFFVFSAVSAPSPPPAALHPTTNHQPTTTNQPINPLTHPPTHQPTNPPTHQPTNPSTHQTTKPPNQTTKPHHQTTKPPTTNHPPGALQGVGWTPWRPLVSAALPVHNCRQKPSARLHALQKFPEQTSAF